MCSSKYLPINKVVGDESFVTITIYSYISSVSVCESNMGSSVLRLALNMSASLRYLCFISCEHSVKFTISRPEVKKSTVTQKNPHHQFETTPVLVATTLDSGKLIDCHFPNRELLNAPEDVKGSPLHTMAWWIDQTEIQNKLNLLTTQANNGESVCIKNIGYRSVDGATQKMELWSHPMSNANGKTILIHGVDPTYNRTASNTRAQREKIS